MLNNQRVWLLILSSDEKIRFAGTFFIKNDLIWVHLTVYSHDFVIKK